MNGEKEEDKNPDLEMDAGHFMQFAEGYKTIEELLEYGVHCTSALYQSFR